MLKWIECTILCLCLNTQNLEEYCSSHLPVTIICSYERSEYHQSSQGMHKYTKPVKHAILVQYF